MLGTRLARVVSLHPDGRLECEVETEALEPERQFVTLEPRHLDQLAHKLASAEAERDRGGAIGAPRTDGAEGRARTSGVRVFPIEFPPPAQWEELEEEPESSQVLPDSEN